MPRFAEDLGATGFAIDHHYLNLVVVTLGEEDVSADDEVLMDILRLEGKRTDLLIGLLIGSRLARSCAAVGAIRTAKSGPDRRALARRVESPPATGNATHAGNRTASRAHRSSADAADRSALHRSFEFVRIA